MLVLILRIGFNMDSVLFPSFDFFEVRDVMKSSYTDSRLSKFPYVIFEDKFIISYERNINSSLLLLTHTGQWWEMKPMPTGRIKKGISLD